MVKDSKNTNYDFGHYADLQRWCSYWYQLNEILFSCPKSVLEIGVGDKVVGNYLRQKESINYTSLDCDEKLYPDLVGNVLQLPVDDDSYDTVCAFEVLEHLPFEKVSVALGELKRVARQTVIISLPHWGRQVSLYFKLPGFSVFKCGLKFPWPPLSHCFDGEHYWEIGKKGYPISLIISLINISGLSIVRHYVIFDSPYHHIFVLKKKNN